MWPSASSRALSSFKSLESFKYYIIDFILIIFLKITDKLCCDYAEIVNHTKFLLRKIWNIIIYIFT